MSRRGYRRTSRDFGRERARAHIDAARIFTGEVGNADLIVKNAFFSLSGSALKYLLDKYEALYGASAREYAQITIPKWQSGSVQMSGMIAQRLFSLMPPFMPVSQKHQIFEMVWKQYGPRSRKLLYFGPDSDPRLILDAVERYFEGLNVLHKIPSSLESRFDWLSDNDVAVKQQLLNHFMNEQRKAALASARLNLDMMLERMTSPDFAQVAKLSHTILVGNHQLEMRADQLRTGFLLSDSETAATRPKPKLKLAPGLFAAAASLLVLVWIIISSLHAPSDQQPSSIAQQDMQTNGASGNNDGIVQRVPVTSENEANQSMTTGASSQRATKTTAAPSDPVSEAPTAAGVTALRKSSSVMPVSAADDQLVRKTNGKSADAETAASSDTSSSGAKSLAAATSLSGCADTTISSMEDDGATLRLANGATYTISPGGAMRYEAAQWSTGDPVSVCVAQTSDGIANASISNPTHYQKVQALLATSEAANAVSCSASTILRMSDDGAVIETADGMKLAVTSAGSMQYEAAQWSTGDAVNVCQSRLNDGKVAVAIDNPAHYQKVQATAVGQSRASSIQCRSTSISSVEKDGAAVITSGGSSYSVSSAGTMQYEAQQWTTGDEVRVCEAVASDGTIAASIMNPAHYAKVQASRT